MRAPIIVCLFTCPSVIATATTRTVDTLRRTWSRITTRTGGPSPTLGPTIASVGGDQIIRSTAPPWPPTRITRRGVRSGHRRERIHLVLS
ncbi:hypothetical protein B0H66DRAFT_163766 [Apodospora peruviana]|uniref:Secreted protein n=1 Tax=Apodospora peruviana TaxID=516989 RepID=A0AAE0IKC0_9PEZI|nr:hypothetical protein B0H66DRAFT_163766 [Apodospora peruviana]